MVSSQRDGNGQIRVGGTKGQGPATERGSRREGKRSFQRAEEVVQAPRHDLKPRTAANVPPIMVRTLGVWGRHGVCSKEDRMAQPCRRNRVA